MGMFDEYEAKCPTSDCDGYIVFQSKAGDCTLRTFNKNTVQESPEVAIDLDGETGWCEECGNSVRLETRVIVIVDEV